MSPNSTRLVVLETERKPLLENSAHTALWGAFVKLRKKQIPLEPLQL